jgi:hypothetical protein
MSWEDFAEKVYHFQQGFMGDPMEVSLFNVGARK